MSVVVAYSTKVLKFKQITTNTCITLPATGVVAYSTKVLKFKQITTNYEIRVLDTGLLPIVQRY